MADHDCSTPPSSSNMSGTAAAQEMENAKHTTENDCSASSIPAAVSSIATNSVKIFTTSPPSSPTKTSDPTSTPNGNRKVNLKGLSSITIPKNLQSFSNISEDYCILLPHNAEKVSHFALDIGGSLIKMVYYEPEGYERQCFPAPPKSPIPIISSSIENIIEEHQKLQQQQQQQQQELKDGSEKKGGRICFARFRTANFDECLSFIEGLVKQTGKCETVHATGGGAFKFCSKIEKRLGIKIRKIDEMESLILGLNFLLKNLPDETFVYTKDHTKRFISFKDSKDRFPYLLVNIGSGVSIIKVDGEKSYERVSGSSLGGGTFWGLCSLMTKCKSFEEMLDLTLKGDNRNVDMLVNDIYGRDYGKFGLAAETIASSIAKPIMKTGSEDSQQVKFTEADVAKSLLYMICNNIGQIAYLNAQRFNIKRIYFAGYFIRDHPITMRTISYAINFWSKGEAQALFLKHEGYLGSIGSFFYDNAVTSGSSDKNHED